VDGVWLELELDWVVDDELCVVVVGEVLLVVGVELEELDVVVEVELGVELEVVVVVVVWHSFSETSETVLTP
jgi:hypothetical protein